MKFSDDNFQNSESGSKNSNSGPPSRVQFQRNAQPRWGDVLTKPLQGAKFCLMHAFLMNCPIDYHEDQTLIPTTSPTLTKTIPTSLPIKPTKQFVPSDNPTDNPMKARSLRPTPSLRVCVETQSHGTGVPVPQRRTSTPTKNVTWRDALISCRLPISSPLPSREPPLII